MVLNLTNQCNLSCGYCYEFGEDKVATPEGKPKFMSWEIAKSAVDRLFLDSPGRHGIHVTFFGGETLMNFPLLERVVAYANDKAASRRAFDRLQPDHEWHLAELAHHLQFLADNNIGVTVFDRWSEGDERQAACLR